MHRKLAPVLLSSTSLGLKAVFTNKILLSSAFAKLALCLEFANFCTLGLLELVMSCLDAGPRSSLGPKTKSAQIRCARDSRSLSAPRFRERNEQRIRENARRCPSPLSLRSAVDREGSIM